MDTMNKLITLKCNDRVAVLNRDTNGFLVTTEGFYERNLIEEIEKPNWNESSNKWIRILCKNSITPVYKYNSLFYVVTDNCNLRCKFCCMPDEFKSVKGKIRLDNKHILHKIKEFSIRRIILTGGEPLLVDNLEATLKYIKEHMKCKVIIQTNGTLINEENAEMLGKYIDSMDISIQHMLLNNKLRERCSVILELLNKNHIRYTISFLSDDDTESFLYNAIDLAYENNAPIHIKTVDKIGHAIENNYETVDGKTVIKLLRKTVEYIIEKKYFTVNMLNIIRMHLEAKKSCGAFGNLLSLRPDDNLYMCHSLTDEMFKIGNANEMEGNEIDKKLEELKDQNKDWFLVDSVKQCDNCKLKVFCQGPCPSIRYYNQGENVDCSKSKILLLYNMFYYDEDFDIENNMKLFLQSLDEYDDNIKKLL